MSTQAANEILINAVRVSADQNNDIYEFVLNDQLYVVECVHVESLTEGIIYPVQDFKQRLQGVLFELNHVRVNPRLDNNRIIGELTDALKAIGVRVYNIPKSQSMAVCYRPLGEITENVRFKFEESGKCTFLCPNNAQLRSVPNPVKRRFGG